MIEASQLLLDRIDKVIQSKSNNKFNYDNIRKISFTIDCVIIYLSDNNTNCHIDIKYSEIIDNK